VYDRQIQRLTHQCVAFASLPGVRLLKDSRRCEFEEETLQTLRERLASLLAIVDAETATLARLEEEKVHVQQEIHDCEESLAELHKELQVFQADLDEKTKELEKVKRTTAKAMKGLEQVVKEIGSKVRRTLRV
jgi:structural maintenance of chromosome 1